VVVVLRPRWLFGVLVAISVQWLGRIVAAVLGSAVR
jgi:hypothetical protein